MGQDEQVIITTLFNKLEAQVRQDTPVTHVTYNEQGQVVALTVKHAELSQLPAEIRHLTTLETLDLSFNQFDRVPVELIDLPSLRVLDMYGNRIKSVWNYPDFRRLGKRKDMNIHDFQFRPVLSSRIVYGNPTVRREANGRAPYYVV